MVTFTVDSDFADVVDGLEVVLLSRRGTSTTDVISHALQRAVKLSEVGFTNRVSVGGASDGNYTTQDVVWHLPVEELATRPRIGDVISDKNSERWTILAVAEQTLSGRWRCVTRNLALVYALDDTVVIEQAVYAKGTGGALEETFITWRAGVRARIQEVEATANTEDGARRTDKRYQVFVAEDYVVGHTHRIRDRKGNYYRVLSSTGVGTVGQLQVIEVETWR